MTRHLSDREKWVIISALLTAADIWKDADLSPVEAHHRSQQIHVACNLAVLIEVANSIMLRPLMHEELAHFERVRR